MDAKLSAVEATKQLAAYFEAILSSADHKPQSEAGAQFEALAELSDDDSALSEMQDLGLV